MKKFLRGWVLAVAAFSVLVLMHGVTGKYYRYQEIAIALPEMKVNVPDPEDIYCLALNIYFEARNQKTLDAKASVGYVVLNRVNNKNYPDSICGVVEMSKKVNGRMVCQFSWYCDNRDNVPNLSNAVERKAWKESKEIAIGILNYQIENPIEDAIFYHTPQVNPSWAKHYEVVGVFGDHIFYR